MKVAAGSGLRRSFGKGAATRFVVDGVDLDVQAGEMVALIGPSGSGKSTLLHLLSGFDTPTEGSVTWAGVDHGSVPRWNQVAVVPQSLGLLAELTFEDHLWIAARGRRHGAVEEMLEQMDIRALASRLPEETSLGQQQRLAVGRALIADPLMLVADEPTSHQDADHAAVIVDALARYAARGGCCLVTSHDERCRAAATRVLSMRDGVLTPHVGEGFGGS